jgi:hypothetical protein
VTALVTLWVTVDGEDSRPITCGPKAEVLAAGRALDAAGVTLTESQWQPCCRDPELQAGCIRDQWSFPDDELAERVVREAAARIGCPLPEDIAGTS